MSPESWILKAEEAKAVGKVPTVDEWLGCYPSAWRGLIVPEAFAHP